MLKNTFCHINGIGEKSERKLWDLGILRWDDAANAVGDYPSIKNFEILKVAIEESRFHLELRNPKFFAAGLSATEIWRIFSEFRDSVAYIDIETNGAAGAKECITTISMFDGLSTKYYIRNQNLDDFKHDVEHYRLLVTYNGKCFDIPVIQKHLGIRLDQAHIDLRYVLSSLGYKGGLKGCEKMMGLDRGGLTDVNGYFAVLLWREYRKCHNLRALETLLAYNILDAANLEYLMVRAFNEKLAGTPFCKEHQLPLPNLAHNPFEPDMETIDRLRKKYIH
jgi:uncharacterized protein